MAKTVACTINGWKWCRIDGTEWTSLSSPTSSNIYGGGSFIGLISFKTPSFSGSSIRINLSLNIIKVGDTGPTSSSPYIKIGTVYPGSKDMLDPSKDGDIGTVGSRQQISVSGLTIQNQKFTFEISNSKLQPNKTYYLWIYDSVGIQPYQHSSWNTISITYQDQVTVSYDANGGSGAPSSQTGAPPITLSTTKPTRTYYQFAHWNTKSDGSGTTYSSGGKYSGTTDIKLYAIWKPIIVTVSYNANGGSGAPASQKSAIPITLSTTKPTKTNCRFDHWNTKSDGTGTKYSSGGTYSKTTDITLYAIWDYKLTFSGGDGGVVTNISTGESGNSLSYWKTHNVSYSNSDLIVVYDGSTGKIFKGWSPSLPYSDNAPKTFTPSVNYKTFTVKFYDGYTSNPLKTLTNVAYGSSIDQSDFPATPTRPGHKFVGWQGNTSYVTSNRAVVAIWETPPVWIMTADGWVKYTPKENT